MQLFEPADWTQAHDVADKYPKKVEEMTKLMFAEFAKNQVLPLDAAVATRIVLPRPNLAGGRLVCAYGGERVTGIPHGGAPQLLNSSYTMTAELEIPEGGAEGMINTNGVRFGGCGFYLLKGKPVFTWDLLDLKRVRWEASEVLTPGKHTVEFDFKYDGLGFATLAFNNISGIGRSGTGVLKVDGKEVAKNRMVHTVPLLLQWDETFDIGADTRTPVDDTYEVPFYLTAKLEKLTIKVDPPKLTPEDEKKLKKAKPDSAAPGRSVKCPRPALDEAGRVAATPSSRMAGIEGTFIDAQRLTEENRGSRYVRKQ
jgi:hypothetical protein